MSFSWHDTRYVDIIFGWECQDVLPAIPDGFHAYFGSSELGVESIAVDHGILRLRLVVGGFNPTRVLWDGTGGRIRLRSPSPERLFTAYPFDLP